MSKSFTTEMPVVPRCPIFWASSNSNSAASVVKIIRFGQSNYTISGMILECPALDYLTNKIVVDATTTNSARKIPL